MGKMEADEAITYLGPNDDTMNASEFMVCLIDVETELLTTMTFYQFHLVKLKSKTTL